MPALVAPGPRCRAAIAHRESPRWTTTWVVVSPGVAADGWRAPSTPSTAADGGEAGGEAGGNGGGNGGDGNDDGNGDGDAIGAVEDLAAGSAVGVGDVGVAGSSDRSAGQSKPTVTRPTTAVAVPAGSAAAIGDAAAGSGVAAHAGTTPTPATAPEASVTPSAASTSRRTASGATVATNRPASWPGSPRS